MNDNFNDIKYQKIIALFAIMQVARIIYGRGVIYSHAELDSYELMYKSIFIENYESVLELYGNNVSNLRLGSEVYFSMHSGKTTKESLYDGKDKNEIEGIEYSHVIAVLIIRLQKKLFSNKVKNNQLVKLMDLIKEKERFIGIDSNSMQIFIASAVEEIIESSHGALSKKIMTNKVFLSLDSKGKTKVYCSLFAGIRAAYIWRELGGGFFTDVMGTWQYKNAVDVFLKMDQ